MLAGLIPLVKDQIAAAEDRPSSSAHVNDKSHNMTEAESAWPASGI